MITQDDILSILEDFEEFLSHPQCVSDVISLMEIALEHIGNIYHPYSFQFMNTYPYYREFCPRFVRELRWSTLGSINDSHRHLGGSYTLDCQLRWNVSESRTDFNSYTDDVVLSDRYE